MTKKFANYVGLSSFSGVNYDNRGVWDLNDQYYSRVNGSWLGQSIGTYTSILKDPLVGSGPSYQVNSDSLSSYLILALPFVSSGRDSGFGDYSGDI